LFHYKKRLRAYPESTTFPGVNCDESIFEDLKFTPHQLFPAMLLSLELFFAWNEGKISAMGEILHDNQRIAFMNAIPGREE